ncbi:MAG: cyclic nucleotide-binding protein [Labilithrix sp.]|nr:cyclic nucleotide-binding protein [Labilithrix sp.]
MSQLDLTERILRLRGVPTLTNVPASDLTPLAASLRQVAFRKGDVLLREDEPPRSFFLIGTGTVVMRRKGKRIGTVRGPGGVGFMSFLARNAGGTSAVAENYVEALEVQADAMEEIFEDHFSVLLGTLRLVTSRFIDEVKMTQPSPFAPGDSTLDRLVGDKELGIVERIFLLRRMRVFTEANVNSLATLAQKMVEVRPAAGTVLWSGDDPANHSFFVVKGMLETVWNDGTFVHRMGPGYVVGGAEAMVSLPRWNELTVKEPAVLLRASRDDLIDLFEDDTELGLKFISMMATLLVDLWDRKAEAGIASFGNPEGLVSQSHLGEAGPLPVDVPSRR